MLRHIALVLLMMTLCACAANPVVRLYEGDPRPTSEVLRVEVPMALQVLTINEHQIENLGGLFSWGPRELHLQPGTYRFVAYYKDLFELDADQHDVVKSAPVIFTVSGEAGDAFRLAFEKPATVDEARKLARRFEGWTEHLATGEKTPTRASGMVAAGGFIGLLDAAQPVATSETVPPAEQARTSASASAGATYPVAEDAQSSESGSASATLDQMKTLWKGATQAERQQFLLWLAE